MTAHPHENLRKWLKGNDKSAWPNCDFSKYRKQGYFAQLSFSKTELSHLNFHKFMCLLIVVAASCNNNSRIKFYEFKEFVKISKF